jgi:acyl carrier protein
MHVRKSDNCEGLMELEKIIDRIIEMLAEQNGRDAAELRAELEKLGPELPIDSVLAAEVLARIEAETGVQLQATAETSQSLRSVRRFAQAIYDQLVAQRRKGA